MRDFHLFRRQSLSRSQCTSSSVGWLEAPILPPFSMADLSSRRSWHEPLLCKLG